MGDIGEKKIKLKKRKFALLLTKGLGLKSWDDMGILSREVNLYNSLAEHFKNIYIFSYLGESDRLYRKYLKDNIVVIPNKYRISKNIYSLLMPLLHYRVFKQCKFIKTNQMFGAETALICKLLIPRIKVVARTGYMLSFRQKMHKKFFCFIKSVLLEHIIYRICRIAIVSSTEMKKDILKRYKIDSRKVYVVPNYVDTDIFKPGGNKLKISDRIVCVNRLEWEKNIKNIIKSIKGTGFALDIIGEGRLKQEINDFARSNNVDIKFLGIIQNDNLAGYLNRYEIYVISSFYENMPKTLLEAMSCGLACIGTDVRGIKEVIKDKINGILIKSDDYLELRKAIMLLSKEDRLRQMLQKNARQTVIAEYSFDINIKKELSILSDINS